MIHKLKLFLSALLALGCFVLLLRSCAAPAAAADATTDDDRVNEFLEAFSSELDRIETAQTVGGVTGPLTNGAINGYTVYGAMNSLEYYYYRYYDDVDGSTSGRLQPSGSSCSGAYKIEGDDNIYFASCFTFGRSGGQLVSASHYSMNIGFDLVSFEDLGLSASDLVTNVSTINDAFAYGIVFDVPQFNNNFLKILYRGSGLLNSSSWQTGATSGFRIVAAITPNNYYPVVTAGYDWGRNPLFSTYNFPDNGRTNLDDIFENITFSAEEPWEAYNTLVDVFSNRFPDMDLDYVPFHGAQYEPAEIPTDPTEPVTELYTVPVFPSPLPVPEIVTETQIDTVYITDESGETVTDASGEPITETQVDTVYVTDSDGDPVFDFKIAELPDLPTDDFDLDFYLPSAFSDRMAVMFDMVWSLLDSSGLAQILGFCFVISLLSVFFHMLIK